MSISLTHRDLGTARTVSVPPALAFAAGVLATVAWFVGSLWPTPVYPGRFCLLGSELAASSGQFGAVLGAPVVADWRCPPG